MNGVMVLNFPRGWQIIRILQRDIGGSFVIR